MTSFFEHGGGFIIFVALVTTCIMWNRYQWRKTWEAYYKRAYALHKTPDDRYEEEALLEEKA